MFLVYNALASGPAWSKTLLLIVYDGGFHDHVPPPEAADDDPATFGRYGVRITTIAVSPWVVPRSACRTRCSTTRRSSTRYSRASAPLSSNPRAASNTRIHWLQEGHRRLYMGRRVAQATDLSVLLTGSPTAAPSDRTPLVDWYTVRQTDRARKLATNPVSFPAEERVFTDLQRSTLAAAKHIRDAGLPDGQP